jgi:hypothetical protein
VLIFDVPREKIWCEIAPKVAGRIAFPKGFFNQVINHVFYIAARAGVTTFCFAWGMGWKSAKVAKKVALEA